MLTCSLFSVNPLPKRLFTDLTLLGYGLNRVKWSLLLLISLSVSPMMANDWPVYRGLNRDGISPETVSGIGEIVWKADVGLGYSAAVVADGVLVISGHDGKNTDTLLALDTESGAVKWKHSYPQPLGDLYFDGGTTGTATIADGRVYHNAREGEVFCLDLQDGKVMWKRALKEEEGFSKPTWGFTGAPLVKGDRVYLTAGSGGIALDKGTGATIWKSEDEEAGYSTPYFFEHEGRELMITTDKRHYSCVDPTNGDNLWKFRWMTRYGVNAADPIVKGNHIFISSGYGKGAALLEWDGSGEPKKIWQSREMRNQMNACILINGYLYGIDGNESVDGTGLKCLDFLTGETKWADTSIGHGAICAASGPLVVLTENGELQLGEANPDGWKPFDTKKVLSKKIWTVPVIANGTIYCRNASGNLVAVSTVTK